MKNVLYCISTKKGFILGILLFAVCLSSTAKITRIEVTKTEPFHNGKVYGEVGAYQKITGLAYGEVDPKDPLNRSIQDIALAPVNTRGMVEYISQFIIVRPIDQGKSNGILFLSLPNRGNPFVVDETLLKRGYTYLWAAWQGDVLPGGGRLTIKIPVATEHGKEITGLLRTEYVVSTQHKTLNLSSGAFTGLIHSSYETVSLDNTGLQLTKRVHEADPRVPVPNSDWSFSDCASTPFPGTPSTTKISVKGGFDPNYIYELIYRAKNPLVLGLGFAAIRDVASLLKNDTKDAIGEANPIWKLPAGTYRPFKAAILQGVSQCSNFTRTFLELGFNQDEKGRKVFEGVNAHIGPRRIALNIRFGRPGGGGMQHEDHLFQGNQPPFTWDERTDPVSGFTGGILSKCIRTNTAPLIMQTFSSTEYWQSRACLTHTQPDGKQDLPIPANVRIYLLNGTEHSPMNVVDPVTGFNTNNNPTSATHSALIVALEQWIMNGTEPPKSAYPTIAGGTLVASDQASTGWPSIPGVPYNGKVNNPPLLDFGPDFNSIELSGILREPPVIVKDKHYVVLVPKVDRDGNETGGIRNLAIRVPIGTYTGWSIRRAGFSEGDLASLNGMFIPFKSTKSERLVSGDPRLSLEERYVNHEGYVQAVRKACAELVKERYMLPDAAAAAIAKADSGDVLK